MKTDRALLKCLLRLLAPLAVVLFALPAFAFGTVTMKSTSLDEVDGRWKLEMDINYGSTPEMGHIPFDFVFTNTTYYEYSITDGDKEPQIRPKPMQNQQPSRESVDIDFADAKNKIWPRTKFQIAIKRDRGFEAGEYTLVIKRASDGATLGQPIRLKFNGKNKLVDRRAMDFTKGEPGKDKAKDKDKVAAKDNAGEEKKEEAAPAAAPAEATEPKPEEEAKAPPPVEKRPGSHGCGCRAAGSDSSPFAAAGLSLIGLAALVARRRRY